MAVTLNTDAMDSLRNDVDIIASLVTMAEDELAAGPSTHGINALAAAMRLLLALDRHLSTLQDIGEGR